MEEEPENYSQRMPDVLGISDHHATERILLLEPKEDRWKRDPSYKLLARTYCEIVFNDEDGLAEVRYRSPRIRRAPEEAP